MPSSSEGRALLLCRTGRFAGLTHELGPETTVGRGSENDISLDSHVVSSAHARITREEDHYYVEDLGSVNGTTVDGVPLRDRTRLERLSVLTIAREIDLIFVEKGAPATDGEPVPAATPANDPGERRTVVEPAGFGAIPELSDASAEPAQDPAPGPEPTEEPASPSTADRRTMVEPAGFAALPDLGETEPEPTPEAARPTEIQPGAAEPPDTGAESPAAVRLEVVVVVGGGLRRYALEEGENSLGRTEDNDIAVPDPEKWVSRRHAVLRVERQSGPEVLLIDQGSANGTFVRGERVREARLRPGESFRLGPHLEFTVLEL